MDLELEELESPSAGASLKTPGQQCPPNEGIWETGRTTTSGILTAGAGLSKKGNISLTTERDKYENHCRHLFDSCDPVKTQA